MDIFISSNGRENADGTKEKPICSFKCALKFIENNRTNSEQVIVYVREGKYRIDESIKMSGIENVSFVAYKNEHVVLTAGKKLYKNSFTPSEHDGIYEVDLSQYINGTITQDAFGIKEKNTSCFPVIKKGDRHFELSRWPKKGYLKIEQASEEEKSFVSKEIADSHDTYFYGFPKWEWADCALPIDRIENNRIYLKKTPGFGVFNGSNFCFMNVFEKMENGEWCFSGEKNKLYFYEKPEDGIEFSYAEFPLITMSDCSNILVKGITFEMTRVNGVECVGGENIRFEHCVFTDMGKTAVVFGSNERGAGLDIGSIGYSGDGGKNNGIENCIIHSIGMGGVSISGGDRENLIPCGNYVKNCEIFDYALFAKCYRPAVSMFGVGCIVSGNKIHGGDHMGIGFEGNEHIIEGNDIYDVCRFSDDAGAIYTLRDWTFCGSVIRNNYIHDINSGIGKQGVFAIYLDDCSGTIKIYGNLFERVPVALMVHGGRNIEFYNNIIKDTTQAFRLLKHHKEMIDKCQIILANRIGLIDINKPCWDKYSIIRTILEDEPREPKYITINDNLLINSDVGIIQKNIEMYGRIDNKILR